MKEAKFIQITAVPIGEGGCSAVYALDDNGDVWEMTGLEGTLKAWWDTGWARVPMARLSGAGGVDMEVAE